MTSFPVSVSPSIVPVSSVTMLVELDAEELALVIKALRAEAYNLKHVCRYDFGGHGESHREANLMTALAVRLACQVPS